MILSDKHIVLTHNGSVNPFKKLENFGATLHHFPMINIVHATNVKAFNLSDYDYYIFTSKNGVVNFLNLDFVKEKSIKAICLGEKTKQALVDKGIEPVFVSKESYSSKLVEELLESQLIEGKQVLLVLGNLADDTLQNGLESSCNVSRLNIYTTILETRKNKELEDLINIKETVSVFTSPSSFKAFDKLYNAKKNTLVSIGNTTSNYIKMKGYNPEVIAEKQTYEGVSEAIINYYESKNISI